MKDLFIAAILVLLVLMFYNTSQEQPTIRVVTAQPQQEQRPLPTTPPQQYNTVVTAVPGPQVQPDEQPVVVVQPTPTINPPLPTQTAVPVATDEPTTVPAATAVPMEYQPPLTVSDYGLPVTGPYTMQQVEECRVIIQQHGLDVLKSPQRELCEQYTRND